MSECNLNRKTFESIGYFDANKGIFQNFFELFIPTTFTIIAMSSGANQIWYARRSVKFSMRF